MINGIYSGAAAMDVLAQQQEIISDNLMHANSSGHRKKVAGVAQRFDKDLANLNLDLGPEVALESRDFKQGRMIQTDRALDITIHGDGFFAFEKNTQEYLTRDGRVYRDAVTGNLVNAEGFPLQGENGPITIDSDISDRVVTVASDGTISAEGNELGKIKIVSFADNQKLLSDGEIGFVRGPAAVEVPSNVSLGQFEHELSNVEPVSELVALIINSRQHQALERATRTISEALGEHIRG